MSATSGFLSWFSFVSSKPVIDEEKMEEYRMLSGFKPKEIFRLYSLFNQYSGNKLCLTRDTFLSLSGIKNNPLKERISFCFGLDEEKNQLNFQEFLVGMAMFNAPGQREQKLRTAFKIQDLDNDGVINKSDLIHYLRLITSGAVSDEEIGNIAQQVLLETSSDMNQEVISFADFQKVVAPLDFQAKLLLPI
jgi:Ca2+-binding EF-hand superfamily protein